MVGSRVIAAHEVFICYAADDREAAVDVCHGLEERGLDCWIAPRDVTPGKEYARAIVEAIDASRLIVLMFTESANRSPHVRRELERAVSNDVAILPLRLDETEPSSSISYFISSSQWLDGLTPPASSHVGRLAEAVYELIEVEEDQTRASAGRLAPEQRSPALSPPSFPPPDPSPPPQPSFPPPNPSPSPPLSFPPPDPSPPPPLSFPPPDPSPPPQPPPDNKSKKGLIIGASIAGAVIFLALLGYLVRSTGEEGSSSTSPDPDDAEPADDVRAPKLAVPDYDAIGQFVGVNGPFDDYVIGECINLPADFLGDVSLETDLLLPERADCQEPHNAEVFQIGEFRADPGTASPGERTLFLKGAEACFESFTAFTATGLDDHDFAVLVPLGPQWDRLDDRTFVCFAYRLDGASVTGSLRTQATG